MTTEVYRVNEFCNLFAISRTSFYREIKAKRLPVMKRGCRTYVSRVDAEAWVASQKQILSSSENSEATPDRPRPRPRPMRIT
jgi:predicted DNA-binding transcriptional regulator AlpA